MLIFECCQCHLPSPKQIFHCQVLLLNPFYSIDAHRMTRDQADAMIKEAKMPPKARLGGSGKAVGSFKKIGPGTTRLLLQGPHVDPDGRLWTASLAEDFEALEAMEMRSLGAQASGSHRKEKGNGVDRKDGNTNSAAEQDLDGVEGSAGSQGDDDGGRIAKGSRVMRQRIFW